VRVANVSQSTAFRLGKKVGESGENVKRSNDGPESRNSPNGPVEITGNLLGWALNVDGRWSALLEASVLTFRKDGRLSAASITSLDASSLNQDSFCFSSFFMLDSGDDGCLSPMSIPLIMIASSRAVWASISRRIMVFDS
jgi:hypothetical protein